MSGFMEAHALKAKQYVRNSPMTVAISRLVKKRTYSIFLVLVLLILGYRYLGDEGPAGPNLDIASKGSVSTSARAPYFESPFPKRLINRYLSEDLQKQLPSAGTTPNNFDPRFMPGLILQYVNEHLDANKGVLVSDFKIPFSWNEYLNLDHIILNHEYFEKGAVTCESFARKIGKTENAKFNCRGNIQSSISIEILENILMYMSVVNRQLYGSIHIYHSLPVPKNLALLGVAGKEQKTLLLKTKEDQLGLEAMVGSLVEAVNKDDGKVVEHFFEGVSNVREAEKLKSRKIKVKGKDVTADSMVIGDGIKNRGKPQKPIDIPEAEFEVNFETLAESLAKSPNARDQQVAQQIKETLSLRPNIPKYFSEAYLLERKGGTHHDWRFFTKDVYTFEEERATMHRLTRAWFRFAREAGVHTWINHGPLIGWYFNGMNLPWDFDIDVQVTSEGLFKLAREFNQTLIVDYNSNHYNNEEFKINNDAELGYRSFYLDLGPYYGSRKKDNAQNSIDARLIDITTGIYLDITALSYTPELNIDDASLSPDDQNRFIKAANPKVTRDSLTSSTNRGMYFDEVKKNHGTPQERKVYHCRNNHFYSHRDISPILPTDYESEVCYIPHDYVHSLDMEFEIALQKTTFNNNKYKKGLRLWVPDNEKCSADDSEENDKACMTSSKEIQAFYGQTKDYTLNHEAELAIKQKDCKRPINVIDNSLLHPEPWVIQHVL